MITGINTDIDFQGKTYHVQTEDIGKGNPTIVSILFFSGAILYKRKTSYAEKVQDPNLPAIVKDMIAKQHRGILREVMTGQIFEEIEKEGGRAAGNVPKTSLPGKLAPIPLSPAQKAASKTPPSSIGEEIDSEDGKSLDDMILDYLDTRGEEKKPGG